MKTERRTYWFLWRCDREGCTNTATTHPGGASHDPVEEWDTPPGWLVIAPPRFWKGPSLSFCSEVHRNEWATATVGPLLLGPGS